MFPTSAVVLAWLWWARARTERAARGLLAVSARAAPWLSIPGGVVGVVIGIKVHLDYVARADTARTERALTVCADLDLEENACVEAARRCLPRPLPLSTSSESYRACIEERLR